MAGTTVNDTAMGKSMVVDALTRSIPNLIDEERSKP